MTVLVKFQIEIRFSIWIAREFKIVDDVMSTIIWLNAAKTYVSNIESSQSETWW